jgi:phospholipid-binding lipoprotein MlaA
VSPVASFTPPSTARLSPFAAAAGMKASETVNSRALNLELFEDVEEGTLDMYSAVRNGYLQRRGKAIQE